MGRRKGLRAGRSWARFAALGAALLSLLGGAAALPAAVDPDAPVRVVVELADQPVVAFRPVPAEAGAEGEGDGRVDLAAPALQAYEARLAAAQEAFAASLAGAVPGARVGQRYRLAFNGLAVTLPASAVDALRRLPGVAAVSPVRRFEPQMDASLPLLGLVDGDIGSGADLGIWKQVGGHDKAGQGIKIADIDSGIDHTHDFFNPLGFSYPRGFPKFGTGFDEFVTAKVIVARAYFRDLASVVGDPTPMDNTGHGTHTAGTIAGNHGTVAGLYGVPVSGVAPRAWLMNYRVFYRNSVDGGGYAEDPELLMAIEDAVRDGADVINNSWGGPAQDLATDPLVKAMNAAVGAGIVVVFSAGNEGPSVDTIGSPGTGPKFITVGASTTGRSFRHELSTTAPAGGPQDVGYVSGAEVPITGDVSGPYLDSLALGNELGCDPFAAGVFAGSIALVKRGTCDFAVKVNNAAAAGAIAVVMINSVAGAPITMTMSSPTTIPAVMVSDVDGAALRAFSDANPGTAALRIDAVMQRLSYPTAHELVASFSSRGPSVGVGIKPDLVAPGVAILSAAPGGGWALLQGTSMAAPHVTGMAAIVRQLHAKWSPAQVKSAIVNTALLPWSLDASCFDATEWHYPGPQCRGAGRLNGAGKGGPGGSGGPGDPGLTADRVSISLGAQWRGATFTVPVKVRNVAAKRESYAISVERGYDDTAFKVKTSIASFALDPGAVKTFKVTFTIGGDVSPGDLWGRIVVRNPGATPRHELGIPYWVRVLPGEALPAAEVLIVDDDGSNNLDDESWADDYRRYYTDALDALGISYAVLETSHDTCASPWFIAAKYKKTIWFTGDSYGYFYYCDNMSPPHGVGSGVNLYLAGGGRLLATGIDIGYAASLWGEDLPLWFGAAYVQDDIFAAPPPQPSAAAADGNPFLDGVRLDLSYPGEGAGNQDYVDEYDAVDTPNVDAKPLFVVDPSVTPASQGLLGVRLSSEPTIERVSRSPRNVWTPLGYRTILLGFGIEGVNDDTGHTSRSELLGRLLNWLGDTVKVKSLDGPASARRGRNVTFKALAVPSVAANNAIAGYRWSFGDGSPVTPAGGTTTHAFAAAGKYQVRVEATDNYGHKAVRSRTITITP